MRAATTRVLFVNHAAELGGGELALFDLVTSDAARTPGTHVLLLSSGPLRDRLVAAGVPVEVLDAGSVLNIRRSDGVRAAFRVPRLLRLVVALARRFAGVDLVYANSQKAFVAAALATTLRSRPLIWHLHDILDAEHFSGPMRRIAIGLGNGRASLVIANSAATREAYWAAGGKVPVAVVHNGIEPASFTAASRDRAALRANLALHLGIGDAPLLGMFGRLAEWKGQHVAIQALAALPNAHLAVIGGALFGEEDYEAGLRVLAGELGVADRVHFLGFRADVAGLMASVDVVLHASIAPEPFGRVIVEAMMAERPVIAASAGGAREIVEDRRSGLLVAPGDAAALAEAAGELLADPGLSRSLAAAGRTRAQALFSLAAGNARIATIIEAVVAGKSVELEPGMHVAVGELRT